MTKFAHIADTHIRNLKYHSEYREVFEGIYERLRAEEVDYIIHCGDIAHTKTQISPEFVQMTADFFKNLASIAPTYIILGNHDGNLKNANRQDALTPIANALSCDNLFLLKDAGETHLPEGFTLNVLSVFDEDRWVKPTKKDNVNIALYHGSVSGVATDTGWIMEHGDHDVAIFDGFDYAFLGDIHKTNQILDEDGRVRYPGSTIQQNHGESNDKGFLLWNIENKESFTCEHVVVNNPKPFVTVELTKKGRMPRNVKVPEGSRLRIVCNHSIPLHKLRRAMDIAKSKFKPTSVTFLNKAAGDRGSVDVDNNFMQEDLRDTAVQIRLIKEFLKDYDVSDEVLEKVCELNSKYNSVVEESEAIRRNIRWKLKSLEWDNLFNYGEKNRLDFENLNGVVGIFGKNFSGKSSIIDSLLFTLYNSTSKGNRKNLNTINQDKSWGSGKVEIEIMDNVFTVGRECEKYVKKLKGEETEEAKTNVTFSVFDKVTTERESLNGLDRNGTDKNIRKFFGTMDDFLLTSMASQLGSLAFIGEGSTKRKEILAKFLDLEIFEKKFKLAKEDAADLRGILKRLEEIDFDEEIQSVKEELAAHDNQIEQQVGLCKRHRDGRETLLKELEEKQEKIAAIPTGIIDIEQINSDLAEATSSLEGLLNENRSLGKRAKDSKETVSKIGDFIDDFNIQEWRDKRLVIGDLQDRLDCTLSEILSAEATLTVEEKKIQMLDDHEYDPDCEYCKNNKFVKDALVATESAKSTRNIISEKNRAVGLIQTQLKDLNPDMVSDYIEKHAQVIEKQRKAQSDVVAYELTIAKNKNEALKLRNRIQGYKENIFEYEENKEAIENLEALTKRVLCIGDLVENIDQDVLACENSLTSLYKESGSLNQKMADLKEKKIELSETRENYAAYDLLMKCVHTNGIALDIIKNKLPAINEEIASVLANIVDFQVYLQDEDRKLEIFIKHPKYDARPLEMGSGAEKTIAAMAIRLALLNVSSLPKGDVFILDEPGTALDEENMEGFIRILDIVKTHFKTVLLISHLDSMKDCVDSHISIEKKGGFAYVNQ